MTKAHYTTRVKRPTPIVGWLDSPEFDLHENAPGHPEAPARLSVIRQRLERMGMSRRLQRALPRPVSRVLLGRVHSEPYIAEIERLAEAGGGLLDHDTTVGRHSLRAALLAAGAAADATETVLSGRWNRAFCSVRPPGHHATRTRGMGFCIFNNVAVGAALALEQETVARVAIVDLDAHHGNGTQDIFYREPRVHYASFHQHPLYPATGTVNETGAGPGLGTVTNCPLPVGAGDAELMMAWKERVRPALANFRPELLFISAGFDADGRDPLTELQVTTAGFAELSRAVVAFADEYCGGRIVSVLEGGYNLEALADDVAVHVEALLAP